MGALGVILEKLCSYVGETPDSINFTEHNWYLKHEWTEEQEEDFKKWFVDYLYKNPKAQKELYYFATKNKKILEKRAEFFVFSYGWRLK